MTFWYGISPQDVLRKLGIDCPNSVRFLNVIGVHITKEDVGDLIVRIRVTNANKVELYSVSLTTDGWKDEGNRLKWFSAT